MVIKTTLPARRAVSEIVLAYRKMLGKHGLPLSLRVFAASLSETLKPFGGSLSHQTVKNWQDRVHLPHPFYLAQIASHAPSGWQRNFARDILAVLHPETWVPATIIGIRAIENSKADVIFSKAAGQARGDRPPSCTPRSTHVNR